MVELWIIAAASLTLTSAPKAEPLRRDEGQLAAALCQYAMFLKSAHHDLKVSGRVSGGLDRLVLVPAGCPSHPIELVISKQAAGLAGVKPLWSTIYRDGPIGTVGKRITAAIEGKFRRTDEWPFWMIEVRHVHELQITRTP